MKRYIVIILGIIFLSACRKQNSFLNLKSNKSDAQLTSLADYQALLDNAEVMNENFPALGNIASDNYFVPYTKWQAASTATERNAYIWAPDIFEGEPCADWAALYQSVEYCNIALEGIGALHLSASDTLLRNNVKGSALFYRAYAFYDLVQLFAKPYDTATASTDPGIPLRLTSDVNVRTGRGTVQEVYDRIVTDLAEAASMLPQNPSFLTRPSATSAEALLARVYLNMNNYTSSLSRVEKVLALDDKLIDYNTLASGPLFSIPNYEAGNPEILFYAYSLGYGIGSFPSLVDTTLYASYDSNDLRKRVFYVLRSAGLTFRGNYTGNGAVFAGIAINEMYLIEAECNARMGNVNAALTNLNALLVNRYAEGTFVPYSGLSQPEALDLILAERRKELPFTTNIRWEDLRRLNREPDKAITLARVLNGQTYTLPPNDNRYVYPIPPDEIKLNNLTQNPR